jgi:SH3 domain protein
MTRIVILFSLLALSGHCLAETAYVTDLLRLSVSKLPQPGGKKVMTLSSGDAVTVLERQPGYIKVKSQDGKIGWAKAAYLVYEKPARLIVSQLETQLEGLQKQLTEANNNAQSASDHAEKLQGLLQTAEKNSLQHQNLLDQLKQQNQQYESSMTQFETCVPLTILLIASIVCFLIGMYISWYIIDYRLRKRHGGFRL